MEASPFHHRHLETWLSAHFCCSFSLALSSPLSLVHTEMLIFDDTFLTDSY